MRLRLLRLGVYLCLVGLLLGQGVQQTRHITITLNQAIREASLTEANPPVEFIIEHRWDDAPKFDPQTGQPLNFDWGEIARVPATQMSWSTELALGSGHHSFRVISVDATGLESEPSVSFQVNADKPIRPTIQVLENN